ncbi:pteridine reductase [Halomonas denitrificans]|nr:pteridine reductase [Halomonas denitrificans]
MGKGQEERTAIVTGAARRLGAAIAETLHRRGLNVLIHCRGSVRDAEERVAALNNERPGSAALAVADLGDDEAPGRIVSAALEAFGRVDVLVNNASGFYPTPLDRAGPADWDALVDSNQRGPFWLSLAAARAMADRPGRGTDHDRSGAIVNLVDIHGMVPLAGHAIYSQAKAGLIMQTRALAKDLAPRVRVNAVAPGSILWPEGEDSPTAEVAAQRLERVPLGRQGTPDDIAGAVAFLALDAPYVTGQVLAVDGGRTLSM